MTSAALSAARSAPGPDDRDPVATPLAEALRSLVRALRAHALYNHDNPSYVRALQLAREAFAPVWGSTTEVRLQVHEHELRFGDTVVHTDGDRGGGDALAWMLYKDGFRELTLLPGFEVDELSIFLETLHQVRRATPDDDDMVTLLWERDLMHLRYRCVQAEDGNQFATPQDPTGTNISAALHSAADDQAANMVRMEDLEGTLHFLDEQEIRYLREQLEHEYRTDVRSSLADALLDTFETQRSTRVRDEVCVALDALLLQHLVGSAFTSAAQLLREARITAGRAPDISDAHRERLQRLGGRLSEPEVLQQLLSAIDLSSDSSVTEAERLLEELEVTALPTLLRAFAEAERASVRGTLDRAITRIASAHTNDLVRLIAHEDGLVALGAVNRASSMRAAAAVPALAERLGDMDPELRQAAAEALASIGSAGALRALEGVLDDKVRGVRIAAVRAFTAHGYRAALPKLEALVRGKESRAADLTERMAMFEAYGALCGSSGVELLDGLLNSRGFLGRRTDPEVRACAAVALGRIRTPEARAALQRSSSDTEVVVRTAVQRALRSASA